jgi:hypothetical protein
VPVRLVESFKHRSCLLFLHGLQIQDTTCLLLNDAMRAFTPRADRARTAEPFINPLFGVVDNEFLGLPFALKPNARP